MFLSSTAHEFLLRKFTHISQCSLLLLINLLLPTCTLVAQNDKEIPALELGKQVERELAGDAAHSYSIVLATQQYLHVVVEQKGIDVVVTVFAPDGKKLVEVDSPNGTSGPEPVSIVAEKAGNYLLEVRSFNAKAVRGHYQVKVEELRTATPQDKSRITAQLALAEGSQLESEGNAGSFRKAIIKFEEAIPFLRNAGDRAKEVETLNQIGSLYSRIGETPRALDYFNKALPLSRALGDKRGESLALTSIGAAYNNLGEKHKALDYYNQALPLSRLVGDRTGEANMLSNIGLVYDSLGEKQKALDYYNQALLLNRAVGDRKGEAIRLNNIGGVYDSLGDRLKALDFYNQALSLVRAVGDRGIEATVLHNIGGIHKELGDQQKALDYYNQALPLSRAVGDRLGEAHTLNNIGETYTRLGEKQKALDYYDQALVLMRAIGDRRGAATTLNNIGAVYGTSLEAQKALDYYNRALPLHRAVGNREEEALTLVNMATVERDRGNLNEARARVEQTLVIFESLRTKITSQELRSIYFARVQRFYDFYIDVLMRLHRQQPTAGLDGVALQASERRRARGLLDTLAEAGADIREGVDPTLVARERSLQKLLNEKAQLQMNLLSGPHTDDQASDMAKEIEELTMEYQQIEAEIRQKSVKYAALTQPQPLSLKEIQALVLDKDTLLLEYSLGEEHSYLWAVTQNSITSYQLPRRDEIEQLARQVYALLTNTKQLRTQSVGRQSRSTAEDDTLATASVNDLKRLSEILLGSVSTQLSNKRLVVIADGALQYIPFGALPSPQGKTTRKSAQSYAPLIIDNEVVSLPSASTLAVLRQQVRDRKTADKTVVIVADPVFDSSDERVVHPIQGTPGSSLNNAASDNKTRMPIDLQRSALESGLSDAQLKIPRLPGTRVEANQILALVSPAQRKEAFDFEANRQAAMSDELSKYRYVHFATHGFLNSAHPELSGLLFSMVDEKGKPQNGFLRANEIYNLKLPAELIVLSACQTGLGKEIKGEGLVGLTRGFMYAGALRVVVSLWNVSDLATAELMARFYRGMLKGKLRPAAALRAAQVSLMKNVRWKSPYYWAAFTLQGEWK